MSLSDDPNPEPEPSTPRDVTKDDLVSPKPPVPFTRSCEFEKGLEFRNGDKLDEINSNEYEHGSFNESEDNCVWKSCKGWLSPLI